MPRDAWKAEGELRGAGCVGVGPLDKEVKAFRGGYSKGADEGLVHSFSTYLFVCIGLSCSMWDLSSPYQGPNPCALHWKVD